MPRFAIHRRQILLENEQSDDNNNTNYYYLRLEIEGANALKSWKILHNIPSEPGTQSTAILYNRDLPLLYLYIENIVEEESDNYTLDGYAPDLASLWDTGTYKNLNLKSSIPEQFQNGKLEIFFTGSKLYGRFSLMRKSLYTSANKFCPEDKDANNDNNCWYFVKEQNNGKKSVTLTETTLFSSKLHSTAHNKKQLADRALSRRRGITTAATIKADFPKTIKPMLATSIDSPFDDNQWVFEFKWYGVRSIVFFNKAKDAIEIQTRNNKPITHRYPEIVDEIRKLFNGDNINNDNYKNIKCKESVILDGEIVVLNEKGIPDFQKHQRRMNVESASEIITLSTKLPATYYVFDILYLDGKSLQGLPFLDRRRTLSNVIGSGVSNTTGANHGRIRISAYIEGKGKQMFENAKAMDLEGIVAKWKFGRYLQGSRSGSWLKVKRIKTQDCVIIGYTQGEGRRRGYFGSLLLAINDNGKLRFVGRTGSGFDSVTVMELYDILQKFRIQTASEEIMDTIRFNNRGVIWVKPDLVAEVKFREWTNDGIMRIPIFVRLREDKLPQDCTKEEEKSLDKIGSLASSSTSLSIAATNPNADKIDFTNLDKIFWPQTIEHPPLTKKDLIDYYDCISSYILPYLKDRPLSLLRFPDGILSKSFFHRIWTGPSKPKEVASIMLYEESKRKLLTLYAITKRLCYGLLILAA